MEYLRDLIETYWDVKSLQTYLHLQGSYDLIETYWDVKHDKSVRQAYKDGI